MHMINLVFNDGRVFLFTFFIYFVNLFEFFLFVRLPMLTLFSMVAPSNSLIHIFFKFCSEYVDGVCSGG